ncbi:protein phosphatase 1 regulatory subunit 12B isoform X2 [Microcaecilia unicolor]|uniref:Protein phosphatase 1 regulatory subunit n=1 Tax=Microcaecilia unicolor TaxID=1415580 RepID=A0A6P7ZMI7_9AMPH|nr:protein phosphatase 1 regulatory subunit 12B isoform X2 [Microcaecilia unicolor]
MMEQDLGAKRAESARLRRTEQLRRWKGSETELVVVPSPSLRQKRVRVRFEDGAVFLAACSSGDTEDVKKLLLQGADINTVNADGLTSLHQACIDENLDVVKFLVQCGADVNQQDNEGWTPLHAVASCGYLNIAEYLISHGANVASVNSEGEVPLDLAEEASMKDMLQEQIKKQGIDLELSRKEEENLMLQDARQWLNRGKIEDIKHGRSRASALHVAAAKGYLEVMRLLIQAGSNLNVQDADGWTPLHAAAHWGVKEACTILAEALCDVEIKNKLGQTPFDVADESVVEHLEMLQKKQNVLRSEKEVKKKLIESSLNDDLQNDFYKNKEKLLYGDEKDETLKSIKTEKEKKDESSCSSCEEDGEGAEASESETEKEAEKLASTILNHFTNEQDRIIEQIPVAAHNSLSMSGARDIDSLYNKSEQQKDESPSSWRLGLRKTSSQNLMSSVAASQEDLRQRASPLYRSASSPRISEILDNKEKERDYKSYFATVTPRRLNSTGDAEEKENRESAVNLVRSGSYTRHLRRDLLKENETPLTSAPSSYVSTFLKSSSFGRRNDYSGPTISENRVTSPTSPTTTSADSQWQPASSFPTTTGANPTSLVRQTGRASRRVPADSTEERIESAPVSTPLGVITNRPLPGTTSNGVASTNTSMITGQETTGAELRERRRSCLTPVRDEEAESLRKARSRQARQTRRSTQGVTLTDLQEAEKTFSRARAEWQTQEQQSDKTEASEVKERCNEKREEKPATVREPGESRDKWNRNLEGESGNRRLRYKSSQLDSPTTPTSSPTTSSYVSSQPLQQSRLLGLASATLADSKSTAPEMENHVTEGLVTDKDSGDSSPSKLSIRERRRPKERRRATGISYGGKEDTETSCVVEVKETRHERLPRLDSGNASPTTSDNFSDGASSRTSAYTRRENRLASLSSRTDDGDKDYKKVTVPLSPLYENAFSENEKLKAKLREAKMELADIKSKLEKAAQLRFQLPKTCRKNACLTSVL